ILYVADADGTHIQALSRVEKMSLQWPRWSPDGMWIAAYAAPLGDFKLQNPILVIDANTKATRWLPAFATGHISALSWAGNGKQLLYEEQETSIIGDRGLRPGNFVLQNIESGKIRTLFWSPSMATSVERVNGDQLLFDASTVRGNLRELSLPS